MTRETLVISFQRVGTHGSIDWYEYHLGGKLIYRDLTGAYPALLEKTPSVYDEPGLLEVGIPEFIVTHANPAHPQSQHGNWRAAIERALCASIGSPIREGGSRLNRSEGVPNPALLLKELASTMARYHYSVMRRGVHLDAFFNAGNTILTPDACKQLKMKVLSASLKEFEGTPAP
ncbi:MAG: hypothetical protein GC129_05315 [Proteobacteria bacterium]|nr:hypothetical protein [Pseudomonadota bacterium]